MPIMVKANCEQKVPEEKVDEFLELGYSLLDENGKVLEKGKPQSKDDFMIANANLKKDLDAALAENETLVKENVELREQIKSLNAALAGNESIAKKAAKASVDAATKDDETPAENAEEPATPKRGRKAASK